MTTSRLDDERLLDEVLFPHVLQVARSAHRVAPTALELGAVEADAAAAHRVSVDPRSQHAGAAEVLADVIGPLPTPRRRARAASRARHRARRAGSLHAVTHEVGIVVVAVVGQQGDVVVVVVAVQMVGERVHLPVGGATALGQRAAGFVVAAMTALRLLVAGSAAGERDKGGGAGGGAGDLA